MIQHDSHRNLATALLASAWLAACGGAAAGTAPHSQSAAAHETAMAAEEEQAKQHEQQYQPAASAPEAHCEPSTNQSPSKGVICWTDTVNPTEEHRQLAEQHRAVGAQHRAASEALVRAEQQACTGVGQEDRDISPFAHRSDVQSVSPLKRQDTAWGAGRETGETVGATIVIRAVPGLTAQWLQRVIDCHLARNAAIGFETSRQEMAYCPLALRGVSAVVRPLGNAFAVELSGADSATIQEVVRRAQALAPKG